MGPSASASSHGLQAAPGLQDEGPLPGAGQWVTGGTPARSHGKAEKERDIFQGFTPATFCSEEDELLARSETCRF